MSTHVGNRIVVTGMAGAGKSTFARALGEKTSLPVIHLDLYSWHPGWVRVSRATMLEKQRSLLATDRWIVDSNDVDDDLLIQRADTLIILATPWWVCSWRAFKRGIRRTKDTQLPKGCDESIAQRVRDEWAIVFRNFRTRHAVPNRDLAVASRCPETTRVHILHSRSEIDAFVQHGDFQQGSDR